MASFTYEESVRWIRTQEEHTELVKLSYLDKDNFAAAKRFTSSEEFHEICRLLKVSQKNLKLKILDLGCGNGIASYAFASSGHDVIAVDPDLSDDVGLGAVKRLSKAILSGSISVTQSFAESLPFSDETFDIVYARQALHHFSDLNQGLAECARVLKPEGTLLASREHVISDSNQLNEFLEGHILHKLHGGENAYTSNTYISAFEKAGFSHIKSIAPFDSVINHFPTSNSEIRNHLYQALQKKFGKGIASTLIRIPTCEKLYRRRLSRVCNGPGRLYSFLCNK